MERFIHCGWHYSPGLEFWLFKKEQMRELMLLCFLIMDAMWPLPRAPVGDFPATMDCGPDQTLSPLSCVCQCILTHQQEKGVRCKYHVKRILFFTPLLFLWLSLLLLSCHSDLILCSCIKPGNCKEEKIYYICRRHFGDRVSCSLGWAQTQNIERDDLELLTPSP